MKKRVLILSLLFGLLFTLVILLSPVKTVKADGNVCRNTRTGTEYTTLAKALNALTLQDNDVIEMIADYTNTSTTQMDIEKKITIDLNGYNITFTDSRGGFRFGPGSGDLIYTTLILKATGGGSIIKASGDLFRFENEGSEGVIHNHLTVQSGTFNCFSLYTNQAGGIVRLSDESTFFSSLVTITGGTFTAEYESTRTHLKELIDDDIYLMSSSTLPSNPKYKLVVEPKSYVTDENTNASAKINYTEGYSYYRKVTSLSSSDAGKKYIIGYSNLSEKSILLLSGEKYGGWSYIIPDRHVYIPNLPTDTWRVESDSKFYGAVDNGYFYTLSYNAGTGKYRFTNSAGNYLTHTTGTSLTIKTPEEVALAASGKDPYRVDFTFTPSSSYLSTGSGNSTSYITYYTTQRDSKYVFEMYGEPQYSGLGENGKHLYAHLYEKVDIDPEVSTAAIRFGKTITKDMYDFLSGCGTTVTFGVIAKLTSALGGDELEYANAQIKKTITPVRVASAGAAEEDLEGNYYQFALVLSGITSADYETSVTARCFVCIDGHYYYFNPSVYSLKTLANAYYNADDTSAYTDHLAVLGYLKDYGE